MDQGGLHLSVSPPPFPKGSAKLEKAEILQMTVDHLKMLHAAGGKGMAAPHLLTPLRMLSHSP